MKFSDKLTLSSTAVIAILFSTGATFMMVQNHDHLLQSYISRNMQTHDLESFSLESKLTQDATSNLTSFGSDEKAIRSRSMYYLQQVASHMNQPQTQYALLDTKHTVLYATGEKKLFEEHSLNDPQTYRIVSYNNSRIMLVSSQITVGKFTYLLESGYDITSCFQERNRQFQTFFLTLLCVLLFSFLLLKRLSVYLSKPILKLHEASRRIASGNYEKRTSIQSDDEIGELSRSFDEMAKATQQTIQQLEVNLAQREDFMSNFAHEIKTPMTAILGLRTPCARMTVMWTQGKNVRIIFIQRASVWKTVLYPNGSSIPERKGHTAAARFYCQCGEAAAPILRCCFHYGIGFASIVLPVRCMRWRSCSSVPCAI